MRRVSRGGIVSVHDDEVFISTALAGQLIGLKQEGLLRWRVRFFEVDLGTIEVAPLSSEFATDGVNTPVNGAVHPEQ